MPSTECIFETADALALTNLSRKQWHNMMQRQQYEGAPPVKAGHPRYFDRDDLVALFVLDHFIRGKTEVAMAGRIATAVRTELRKVGEDHEFLWVVSTESGTPRRVVSVEPPSDLFRHEINIGKLRRRIDEIVKGRASGGAA